MWAVSPPPAGRPTGIGNPSFRTGNGVQTGNNACQAHEGRGMKAGCHPVMVVVVWHNCKVPRAAAVKCGVHKAML